jgi:hypothetical protein
MTDERIQPVLDDSLTLTKPVELDWYGTEADVVQVCARDQQRFEMQVVRAIQILQLANHADLQLKLLLSRLGAWLSAHSDSVEAAFLTIRDSRFAFIIVSKIAECDDDLEDAVTDLDLEIANDPDLDVVPMNAFVLPPASEEALSSFFDKRFLLVYRGRRA